jgi:hypothetical protein
MNNNPDEVKEIKLTNNNEMDIMNNENSVT